MNVWVDVGARRAAEPRRSVRRACAALTLWAGVATAPPAQAQDSGSASIAAPSAAASQATVTVRPDRATVGDPIVVTARVSAPPGAIIEFPSVVNAAEAIEALDPRVVHVRRGGSEVVAEATWRLVAWDTGAHALPIGDATVTLNGTLTRVPLSTMILTVTSVLPADSSKRLPRPARDIIAVEAPWWDTWSPWLVPLLVLALVWAIWRRNRKERPAPPTARRDAERAFTRLEAGALGAAGEPAREVAIATEIIRDFLAARYPGADVALTTAELLPMVPLRAAADKATLAELLAFADLVKYARRHVNPREAEAFTARAHAWLATVTASESSAPSAAA